MQGKNQADNDVTPILRIFRQQESIIKKYLRRFMSNRCDIEDICQETVMRALEAEKQKDIQEPKAFLFGVTRNLIRKKLDKDSRSLIDFIDDYIPKEYNAVSASSLEEQWDTTDEMELFREAIAQLPEQCQKVFVMKKVYGYSHKEISAQLGISISTIEKHVSNGLKRCNDYMLKRTQGDEPVSQLTQPSTLARKGVS
ncbi:sigma-70 family RNA polymerase sigma factor [Alteromonas sp. C1M14]|uniref:RNA polymerase sigma factor n=1 Tax=Alteromonas sp. C1M14 TaxID=2841567 RepID=UPI001C080971|nr:sigma-70 family RNA polymerase sigma factor [Alteromonas sp. C1M14]MBU2978557.1 sigma-70 family RNA polymerase sigma factor [Alteromonas sp. C1M14]